MVVGAAADLAQSPHFGNFEIWCRRTIPPYAMHDSPSGKMEKYPLVDRKIRIGRIGREGGLLCSLYCEPSILAFLLLSSSSYAVFAARCGLVFLPVLFIAIKFSKEGGERRRSTSGDWCGARERRRRCRYRSIGPLGLYLPSPPLQSKGCPSR